MTFEAQLNIEGPNIYRRYACADGTALAVGQLLVFSAEVSGETPTVIAHSAAGQTPAGYCAREKEASDGQLFIPVLTKGVVDGFVNNAVTFGRAVIPSAVANCVDVASGTASETERWFIVGQCQETASASERVRIKVMIE